MFATTFFAIFVVPISRNPIVKPFLVLENGQIRDQLINSGKATEGMPVIIFLSLSDDIIPTRMKPEKFF